MWAYINLISLKLLLQSWNVELWMQSQKSITRLSKHIWMISNWFYPHMYDGWNQLVLFFCFLGCILSWKDTIYVYPDIFVCYICHDFAAIAPLHNPSTLWTKNIHIFVHHFFFLTSNIIAVHTRWCINLVCFTSCFTEESIVDMAHCQLNKGLPSKLLLFAQQLIWLFSARTELTDSKKILNWKANNHGTYKYPSFMHFPQLTRIVCG
jgi:hypothetical protein